jgi:hypothetical protein
MKLFSCGKKIWLAIILLLGLILTGCKKFVDSPPPTNLITDANVFSNDGSAITVLTGIYTNMSSTNQNGSSVAFNGFSGISLMTGLSADELSLASDVNSGFTPNYLLYYQNALVVNTANTAGYEYWPLFYNYIYTCNAAIEGLSNANANSLTPAVKKQLMGEALFMRAFLYYYLTNMYGDVALTSITDYKVNSFLVRSPQATVCQQIISDLKEAKSLLNMNYLDASLLNTTSERVRPTKAAAEVLLSRTYLYTEDWANAEAEADSVISDNSQYSLENDLNQVFLANNPEAIWQLQPTVTSHNTEDGWVFILPSSGPSGASGYPVYLNKTQLNSFEPLDQRRAKWVDSLIVGTDTFYYPYKYKSAILDAPVTEYQMVLRLGELYLIRAEARTEQSNINGAQDDLNTIRSRAGLPPTSANDKSSLLSAILREHQTELFTEWGDRWFSLKRTGNIDAIMNIVTPQKANGTAWKSFQQMYPLPLGDIQENKNLIQNMGY